MFAIHRLQPGDDEPFEGMLDLFEDVFDDSANFGGNRPDAEYVLKLLANPAFVGLVALDQGHVVGGLVAYELPKFEQARCEYYIYDLAVVESHRRQGIATALIGVVREIAEGRGGWVVMIQADYGDEPAIALYTKLGNREEVLHFDIPIE